MDKREGDARIHLSFATVLYRAQAIEEKLADLRNRSQKLKESERFRLDDDGVTAVNYCAWDGGVTYVVSSIAKLLTGGSTFV